MTNQQFPTVKDALEFLQRMDAAEGRHAFLSSLIPTVIFVSKAQDIPVPDAYDAILDVLRTEKSAVVTKIHSLREE